MHAYTPLTAPAEEKKALLAVFNAVDSNNAAELDWTEVRHALHGTHAIQLSLLACCLLFFTRNVHIGIGFALGAEEVQNLVAAVSTSGMVAFDQFAEIVEDLALSDRDIRRELADVFATLDSGKTGFITADALRAFCAKVCCYAGGGECYFTC